MSFTRSGGGAVGVALALVAVILATAASPALAQDASATVQAAPGPAPVNAQAAPLIQSIVVKGNQRIETDTIASYLVIAPGDRADPALLDVGLKTLMNTGLFSDASLQMEAGGVLLITIKENPIVNRVILDGNKRLKDDKISKEIQLKAREVFTRAKVQADVERMIELYRRSGRFAATITPKVTPLDQNRVDVIYDIDEGPRTGVAKINFIGNKVFTDSQLRGVMLTSESHWWKIFSNNTNYDPDRIEYDQEQLRKFYARHGYADFQVLSTVAELTPDRKNFFITITIQEGPQYRVGEVKVKTTLAKIDAGVLERFVPVKQGQIFDGDKIDKAVESITFATGATGYAFVDVNPRLDRHSENKTVDVTFNVNEGPRVYVERINIKGNTRTLDKVIRREVRISEGDPYNKILVDRSKARIKALDYFSDVSIDEKPGSAPDRTDLDVSVKEKSTGSFSVGVGVSSTEKFIVNLSIEERNLMGRGQYLSLQVQASSRTRQASIQFTQPYFLDRNLSAGFSIFNQRTNFRESGFVRDRIGFGLNTGFQISEFGRGGLNYLFTRDNVLIDTINAISVAANQNPQELLTPGVTLSNASGCTARDSIACLTTSTDPTGNQVTILTALTCNFVQSALTPTCDSRGKFITSLIGYSLAFDKRDDPLDPTHGWRFSVAQALAGLGGDVHYWRTEAAGAYYHPIIGRFIGALKFRAGYVDGYAGDAVRLSDRFFEGADTFRGFEVAGIGPRYIPKGQPLDRSGQVVGQSIGGKIYAIGSAEVLLPLPLPKEYGIRTSAFTDFGTVGLVDNQTKALNEDLNFWVDPK